MNFQIKKAILLATLISLARFDIGYAAYIDPNTGGLLFQFLAAAFAVLSGLVLLFSSRIRMAISRAKRWFRERSAEDAAEEPSFEK